MPKKIVLVLCGVLFFSSPLLVKADVVINEIMYAPATGSNYEWVEIYNSGSDPVDLNNYRFFHGEATSGPLTLRNGSTTVLQPSEYAIIAKSPTVVTNYLWLNFSGMILSASTLSLPDSGTNTYIAISDPAKLILDHVTYDPSLGGSKESSNSLSKINGSWIGATPTPGIVNQTSSNPPNTGGDTTPPPDPNPIDPGSGTSDTLTDSTSGGGGTNDAVVITPIKKEEQKIKTKITYKKLAFVGLPISFQAVSYGLTGELLYSGKYFWNFGDGNSKELNDGNSFIYTYAYPGDYSVSLEYYSSNYSQVPDTVSKFTIKVVPMNVSISKIGTEKDFFVEITNNSAYDVDISKWVLSSLEKKFIFQKNSIILAKKKITLASKITNFILGDEKNLKLTTSTGDLIFDYGASVLPIVAVVPLPILAVAEVKTTETIPPEVHKDAEALLLHSTKKDETKILAPDLLASTISVRQDLTQATTEATPPDEKSKNDKSFWFFAGLALFLGIAGYGVYFLRTNGKSFTSKTGDDFEILDK